MYIHTHVYKLYSEYKISIKKGRPFVLSYKW